MWDLCDQETISEGSYFGEQLHMMQHYITINKLIFGYLHRIDAKYNILHQPIHHYASHNRGYF
jgi:hypothetical protein